MAKPDLDNKGQFLVLCALLPFVLPILGTLLLVLLVGNHFPRDIAPGSGLKLAGLIAALLAGAGVLAVVHRRWPDPQARRFALVLCGVTSLMAWPVWTVGLLPSVNGMALADSETTAMYLNGLEVTQASKSRALNYWARLAPVNPGTGLGAGRYFIPREIHARWDAAKTPTVQVEHATGLLGAEVVRDYR